MSCPAARAAVTRGQSPIPPQKSEVAGRPSSLKAILFSDGFSGSNASLYTIITVSSSAAVCPNV